MLRTNAFNKQRLPIISKNVKKTKVAETRKSPRYYMSTNNNKQKSSLHVQHLPIIPKKVKKSCFKRMRVALIKKKVIHRLNTQNRKYIHTYYILRNISCAWKEQSSNKAHSSTPTTLMNRTNQKVRVLTFWFSKITIVISIACSKSESSFLNLIHSLMSDWIAVVACFGCCVNLCNYILHSIQLKFKINQIK